MTLTFDHRLQEPTFFAANLCDYDRLDREPDRKRHNAFRHPPTIAHLDVRSEARADDGTQETRS